MFCILFAHKRNLSEFGGTDLYENLGLKKGASKRDIERSYRRFSSYYSKILSPSKSLQNQWKLVNDAMTILGDNETLKLYNRYGSEIVEETDFSVSLYRSNIEISALKEMGTDIPNKKLKLGGIITFPIQFSLSHFLTGTSKNITVMRMIPCICKNGGNKCAKCRKTSSTLQTVQYEINLQPGAAELSFIYASNLGDSSKLRGAQEIVFVAYSIPEPNFQRVNSNLYTNLTIPISKAILGGEYDFESINHEKVTIDLGNGVKEGTVITAHGYGFPLLDDSSKRGDLFINIHIAIPKSLNSSQKSIISRILSSNIADYA